MKILALVTDAFGGWGGIARYNRDFLGVLSASARVERVVCIPRLVLESPNILPKNLDFDSRAAHGLIAYLRAIFRNAKIHRGWDLIYCGHVNIVPVAIALGVVLKIPVALQIHGIDAWTRPRRILSAKLAPRVDLVLSTSRFTLARFQSWSGVADNRCSVIPCTYDETAFRPGPKPDYLVRRYDLEGRTVLLTLGRLVSKERAKGFDPVLEALPALLGKISSLTYIIAGAGPDRARLEEKVNTLGLERTVVFTGKVLESEKADHYRLADAYVMPSQGEGFGITLLEAMACGIPVLASTRDGTSEAIRKGELGILVDPLSLADVERGILRVLASSRDVPQGLEYFSKDNFVRKVQAFLDRIPRL